MWKPLPLPTDVLIVAGQSNAVGQGDSNDSPAVTSRSIEYTGSAIVSLADPVGDADTGSAWPAFANSYSLATTRPICVVPTAVNGSKLATTATGSNWGPNGSLFPAAVTKTNDALLALIRAGYNPHLRGVLWCQGEEDADDGVALATYRDALVTLHDRFETEFGIIGFYVFQTGARDDGVDAAQWAAIRDAQTEAVEARERMEMVYTGAVDFPARGLMEDNLHYNQDGLNEMGHFGGYLVGLGPQGSAEHTHDTRYYTETEVDALLASLEVDRYEVIVDGSGPPVAVTNEAGDDWLYGVVA